MALHWLECSDHTTHTVPIQQHFYISSTGRKISIFLIYWTQDCVNVCWGLVWNRYDIINININLLINAGNSSLSKLTSTASNRIHFLGHKINFRNSLCFIKLCLWWPRTYEVVIKMCDCFKGPNWWREEMREERCHQIFMKDQLVTFNSVGWYQNLNCQRLLEKENSTLCPHTIG